MVTTLLLKQLTIFFIYMAAGFMLVKLGILKGEDSKVLSLLCIYVLLPCAILKSYQAEYTPELRDGFMLAMGAAIAAQLVLMTVTYGISGMCHLDATEKASIMYPNSANLILPLVAGVLGDHYMIYASAYSCVQGIFIWTHCTSMMKGSRDLNWKKVFLNINLITVVVGIIMFFGQIHLPKMALDTLGGFSAALGPISMIVIGMLEKYFPKRPGAPGGGAENGDFAVGRGGDIQMHADSDAGGRRRDDFIGDPVRHHGAFGNADYTAGAD